MATAVKVEVQADKNNAPALIYRNHDQTPQKGKYSIVAQTTGHGIVKRVTRVNGEPLPMRQQRAQVGHYVHSLKMQDRQRRSGAHDAKQATQLLRMFPKAYIWRLKTETPSQNILTYQPIPEFHLPNQEGRAFAAVAGENGG